MNFLHNNADHKQCKLYIKIQSGASRNSFGDIIKVNYNVYIKLYIKALRIKGMANKMILEFLASEINLPKTYFSIIKGNTNNFKVILIEYINVSDEALISSYFNKFKDTK